MFILILDIKLVKSLSNNINLLIQYVYKTDIYMIIDFDW